jgi:hypothetical protein
METTPFFILLFAHLSGLILGFGAVLITDLYGLLWVTDRVRFPELIRVSDLNQKFIWVGWGIMVAAGIPLLALKGTVDNLMIIKLFFVAVIGLNGVLLHLAHQQISACREGQEIPDVIVFRLGLALLVSQITWWGAMTIGFLHRHIWTVIEWPDAPWLVCGLILAALLVIWGAGELLFRRTGETVEA